MHSQFSEHLAVDIDIFLFKPVDQGGVVHPEHVGGSIDTNNPQTTKLASSGPTVTVIVGHALLYRFAGGTVEAVFAAVKALGGLQVFISTVTRDDRRM
jgi:hypothetical protein